ncbi:hypothetical protein OG373_33465 [Streptomyces avidinii]|uniref:hypothetical protein n=1 Tax=Streptomyces avidinii TaxID=1895 RepID=UPI003869627D|nr:hypothetical protein OG373_33465 [Streptomyces avidinii]
MPDANTLARLSKHVTEFRMAVFALGVGSAFTVAGGTLYAVQAYGFRELAIGLSLLITGLVMLGSGTVKR